MRKHNRHNRSSVRLEVLEERERIAKELHDGVIQALFAVGMSLQGAGALVHDPEIAGRLEDAVDDIDRAIRDLRNYIFGLRPGILADRQLPEAIRKLCDEFEERTGVVTVASVRRSMRPRSWRPAPATSSCSCARRCPTSNGMRTRRRVAYRCAEPPTVGSNWRSTTTGRASTSTQTRTGMGLANLEARVASMGGTFHAASVAGDGTTITARWPA